MITFHQRKCSLVFLYLIAYCSFENTKAFQHNPQHFLKTKVATFSRTSTSCFACDDSNKQSIGNLQLESYENALTKLKKISSSGSSIILSFAIMSSAALSSAPSAMAVSGGGLDYAGLDLSNQDFSNGNYKGKDFSQVRLQFMMIECRKPRA